MKVYELMEKLSELPSGADIKCYIALTAKELKTDGEYLDDELYGYTSNLDSVEYDEYGVTLGF